MQNLHSLNRFYCSISTDCYQPQQWLHSHQAWEDKEMPFMYREMLRKWLHKWDISQFFFYFLSWHHRWEKVLCASYDKAIKCTLVKHSLLQSCCLAAFSEGERLPHLSPAASNLLFPFVSSNNSDVIKNSISVTSLTRELCLGFCHTGSRDNLLALFVSLEEFMSF